MKVVIQIPSLGTAHQAARRGIAVPSVTSGLESAVSGISIDPLYRVGVNGGSPVVVLVRRLEKRGHARLWQIHQRWGEHE